MYNEGIRTAPTLPSITQQALDLMQRQTGVEPKPKMTLLELCGGNAQKVRMLIFQLELAMQDKLCDSALIDDLQHRTVEFVAWALARSHRQPIEEF